MKLLLTFLLAINFTMAGGETDGEAGLLWRAGDTFQRPELFFYNYSGEKVIYGLNSLDFVNFSDAKSLRYTTRNCEKSVKKELSSNFPGLLDRLEAGDYKAINGGNFGPILTTINGILYALPNSYEKKKSRLLCYDNGSLIHFKAINIDEFIKVLRSQLEMVAHRTLLLQEVYLNFNGNIQSDAMILLNACSERATYSDFFEYFRDELDLRLPYSTNDAYSIMSFLRSYLKLQNLSNLDDIELDVDSVFSQIDFGLLSDVGLAISNRHTILLEGLGSPYDKFIYWDNIAMRYAPGSAQWTKARSEILSIWAKHNMNEVYKELLNTPSCNSTKQIRGFVYTLNKRYIDIP